jgi:CRP/FNR family transcriptional regulator, cyclic AMP receptor protein
MCEGSPKRVIAVTVQSRRWAYHSIMASAIQSSCLECVSRSDRLFCDLPADALEAFNRIKSVNAYTRGSVLFRESTPARGIFLLCEGRARLSVCSESGKRLTLRIVGPGEALGLSAALSGTPYELTAEILEDSQVATVNRRDLLHFLHEHREACLQVVHLLSEDLHVAYDRVRSVGLGRTRRPRVAQVH